MKNIKIKICGVRTLESAQAAVESGADFLGFNFVPGSHRYIRPAEAKIISEKIKNKIHTVGVFQNAAITDVVRIAKLLSLDYVQLHGREDKKYLEAVGSPVIKAIRSSQDTLGLRPHYFLLDRQTQGAGSMVDITVALNISSGFPIFLAGGLTTENVAGVIKQVRPFAVDVAGGVETDKKMDIRKIRGFIASVKGVQL